MPSACGLMSDMSDQSDNDRPGSRRAPPWFVLAIVAVLAGGALLWANHWRSSNSAKVATAQPAPPPPVVDDAARQAVAALQQAVKDLQTAQQGAADQMRDVQRQLAAEQGERKLLSEQLGALSARVDSLMAPNAEAPSPAPPLVKKKRGSR